METTILGNEKLYMQREILWNLFMFKLRRILADEKKTAELTAYLSALVLVLCIGLG